MKPILKITGVTKRYGRTLALDDVSLTVMPGDVVGLIGPNGSGKTTLFAGLMGDLAFDSGSFLINGMSRVGNRKAVNRLVGYVPEIPSSFGPLTFENTLRLHADLWDLKEWEPIAERLVEGFRLTKKQRHLVGGSSKGELQKVSLMRGLLHLPRLGILDEPIYGLDIQAARFLGEWITEQAALGVAFMISSHSLEVLDRIATRIIILKDGRLVWEGTMDDIRTSAGSIEDQYLKVITVD